MEDLVMNIDDAHVVGKEVLLPSEGPNTSQYSPFIVKRDGWDSWLMYYCKNTQERANAKDVRTLENNYEKYKNQFVKRGGSYYISRDRVWRAEFDNNTNQLIGNQIVIDGDLSTPTDLSCSPGVWVDNSGSWHMYYVTADRFTPMDLYLYHATAVDGIGVNWTVQGEVAGVADFPINWLETPSPIYRNGVLSLYFPGPDGLLHKSTSVDGYNFTSMKQLSAPSPANGRVQFIDGNYYYTYALQPDKYTPADQIRIAMSTDSKGEIFSDMGFLIEPTGSKMDWDGILSQTPFSVFENSTLKVYYSGTPGTQEHFTADSSIGYQSFSFNVDDERTITGKPLYRLWSEGWKSTYLTISESEKEDLLSHGWRLISTEGKLLVSQENGSLPVYQFWSDSLKDHYYTISPSEKEDLINHGWAYRGILGYMYNRAGQGRVPVYKSMCGPFDSSHYYLFSTDKKAVLVDDCKYSGILGYVLE